jgi:hypothetical protein
MPSTKASKELKEEAHRYYLKTTRQVPKSPHRIAKSAKELETEIANRKNNFAKGGPKCFKTPIAIDEKKKHDNKPCAPGEERTKNYCVKQLTEKKMDPSHFRWFRVLSPNKTTRITLACPK